MWERNFACYSAVVKQISALKCVDTLLRAIQILCLRVWVRVRFYIKFASRASFTITGRASVFVFLFQSLCAAIFWRTSSRQHSAAFSFIEHFICWRPIVALKFLSAFVSFDIYSTPNHTHKNKTGCCFIVVSRFEWKFVRAPQQKHICCRRKPYSRWSARRTRQTFAHSANTKFQSLACLTWALIWICWPRRLIINVAFCLWGGTWDLLP